MKYRVTFAARVLAYVFAATVIVGPHYSVAQQGAPKAQPKAKPKAAPNPTPQPKQDGQPELTYSFWTKVCQKGSEANAKQVCFIARDAHMESGVPVVMVVLIEPEGEAKKLLRVTLPLGHVAPGRHSRDHRQWPAAHRPLRDLPPQRLHG
ncbi:MAG TPA: invasion associated locus B family protein [Xanthobacteraceae bacterium]|nr:invasion associated locus B family protein [Xanthobacteraceae bacterium]